MRPDLQKSLKHSHIDPRQLSTLQRILLTTDGTLTEILEAYFFEKIYVFKLSQRLVTLKDSMKSLNLRKKSTVLERKILLQGKVSRKNFIYAQSLIVPDRFDKRVQEELERSKKPVGQLWLEHKIETFKEIIDSGKESANELADYFHIAKEDLLLSRTYRVFSNKKPIMMITEKFPESFFRDEF